MGALLDAYILIFCLFVTLLCYVLSNPLKRRMVRPFFGEKINLSTKPSPPSPPPTNLLRLR